MPREEFIYNTKVENKLIDINQQDEQQTDPVYYRRHQRNRKEQVLFIE